MAKPIGTPNFAYTNTHPTGIKSHGDCVFRAISIATGKTWLDVYDELTALGRELLAPPNDKLTYTTYLDRIADRVPVMVNKKRLTAKDLAKRKDGATYVVRQANHLVTVKDGKVRDTWNSSERGSYLIWSIR